MPDEEPLAVAAQRMAAGLLPSEDLPDLACDALLRGLDTPSLRALAGQPRGDVRDSADLFRDTLAELGLEIPDAETALWQLARRTAEQIVAGRLDPFEGAGELALLDRRLRSSLDLRIFADLLDSLDEHPESAGRVRDMIVEESLALRERPRPRCWLRLKAPLGPSALVRLDSEGARELDPTDVVISDDLRRDLRSWAIRGTRESTDSQIEALTADWRRLTDRLQRELGDGYVVELLRPDPPRRSRRRWWRR